MVSRHDSLPDPRQPDPTEPRREGAALGGRERRQWDRARAEWPITLELEDGSHQARLRDVSRGGICFFLDRPIREMTTLKVEFEIPVRSSSGVGGVRRISGTGVVVRSERISQALDHYEIAVFLQHMATPDRETVEAYVSRSSA